jgi:hypothetical protein
MTNNTTKNLPIMEEEIVTRMLVGGFYEHWYNSSFSLLNKKNDNNKKQPLKKTQWKNIRKLKDDHIMSNNTMKI